MSDFGVSRRTSPNELCAIQSCLRLQDRREVAEGPRSKAEVQRSGTERSNALGVLVADHKRLVRLELAEDAAIVVGHLRYVRNGVVLRNKEIETYHDPVREVVKQT